MRSQKWFSRIALLALSAILTFFIELICIPTLFPAVNAQVVENADHIYQNSLSPNYLAENQQNPQLLLEEGKKLYDTENFLAAISVLKQAEKIFQSQGNQIEQAIALSNLSLSYKQIAEYQQALNYINQSHNLLENQLILDSSEEKLKVFAQILDIQANLQLTLGKPLIALENWQQATTIYEKVNLSDEKIRSLINQNFALQALGRYYQASKILEDLLSELEKQEAYNIKATVLRSSGEVHLHLGEIEVSLEFLEDSYKIAEKIKSTPQMAATLLSRGNAKRIKGSRLKLQLNNTTNFEKTSPLRYVSQPISPEVEKLYQQAIQDYQKAIAISTSPNIQIKAQLNLLNILIELEEFSKARNLYSQLQLKINNLPISRTSINARINFAQSLSSFQQINPENAPQWGDIGKILATAIKQAETLGNKRLQSYGMGVLGNLYLNKQKLTDAEEITKKAVDLALKVEARDIAYLWQWQLGYILKLEKNIPKAIDCYSLAVNNLNELRGELLILNPDQKFSFRDNIEPLYRQLVDLLLQPANAGNVSQIHFRNKEIEKNQLNPTKVKGNQIIPRKITYRTVVKSKIDQIKIKKVRNIIEALQLREIENYFQEACFQAKPEIIDTVIDKTDTKAAAIYPIILQDRLEVILKLPNQDGFNRYTTFIKASEVENTLEKLQASLRQPDTINQSKELSAKIYSWLIQPLEKDLKNKNIETLVFVLDGTLRNIPMAVLYDNKSPGGKAQYLIEKYAIVLTPGLQMLDPKPLQEEELHVLLAGVSEKRSFEDKKFTALRNVKFELQAIQSKIPKSKKLLNKSFTDDNLEQQIDSAKYTIVHIATHGNFSSNSEETYILTWDKLLKVEDFDKLFQVNKNLDSQAIQLLVLSACQTASGDKRAALGLSGIAVRAGARSTLATLWSVEDKSTGQLVTQFYQELEKNKLNKAKALQQAQIALLKRNELPKVWAPYVLVGNWL
ncbi:MAG: CHAT domain-containing protein [Mastigocoleus sp.]